MPAGSLRSYVMHGAGALRHRTYRLYFAAHFISLTGCWMSVTATSWLVYRITGSGLALGSVAVVAQLAPLLLIGPAGVLVDRVNRRRLLAATQTALMTVAAALGVLTLSGSATFHVIMAMTLVQGLINAIDLSCRQAIVPQLVSRDDVGQAVALNALAYNGSRLLGAPLAAAVIASTELGWCYVIDAGTYAAMLVALVLVRVGQAPAARRAPPFAQFREGLDYARESGSVGAMLLITAAVSVSAGSYAVLLPVLADNVLRGGADLLGLLSAAAAVGGLAGCVASAAIARTHVPPKTVTVAATACGCGLIALSMASAVWLAVILVATIACGVIVAMTATNAMLQTMVLEERRGRVMSLYLMAALGAGMVGNMAAGLIADAGGVSTTFLVQGCCCMAAAWLSRRRHGVIQAALCPPPGAAPGGIA